MAALEFAVAVFSPGRTLWRYRRSGLACLWHLHVVAMPLPGYRLVAQARLQLGLCDVDAVARHPARPSTAAQSGR